MNTAIEKDGLLRQTVTSIRVAVVTLSTCCLLYPLVIWIVGQGLTPFSADGSLVRDGRGEIVGSALLAQGFSRPDYFWPRPSAVDYNAGAAGGSNLSPAHPKLRERAEALAGRLGATLDNPMPADLATASGSGLDPHITLAAARFQAARVAAARGRSIASVMESVMRHAERPGGLLTPNPLVDVLAVNMELDGSGH